MALKTLIPFPIFAPPSPISTTVTTTTTTTEVRFSRWNNANADKFLRQQRTQKQIEDDLRRYRRFESALTIADTADSSTTATGNPNFKSIGTPSAPSSPSIPGKKSKYSKKNSNSRFSHPAFRKLPRKSKLPQHERPAGETNVKIGEDGLVYEVAGAPFEFMYSYTETPKVKPLGLREAPVAPFGPATMPRPWTGRKPLPESKKKVPEFDSFVAPPKKKGVKPVQRPGPFLPGSGPKYVMSREEVLGEPLTEEEVKVLVEGCLKSKRQLNMGRDGLTHNMLDNIHALWKRRRVCKIKCKGVCTVDMDNVCQQLEDKTGGKIIYRKGGVLYLFRGRNYNYKTRPRFPLMLWKPVTPVYPRLIQRVPEGLTLEEATEMRKRGRQLIPICKLAKNGVYVNLVRDVREAFEACELVRINCQGMNGSDYHKIGAKLKDLVPCVLISFEKEHILMWRGRDWKSSLDVPDDDKMNVTNSETDIATSAGSSFSEEYKASTSCSSNILHPETSIETPDLPDSMHNSDVEEPEDGYFPDESEMPGSETTTDGSFSAEEQSNAAALISDSLQDDTRICNNQIKLSLPDEVTHGQMQDLTPNPEHRTLPQLPSPCTEGIRLLLTQAVENGSALVLDDASLVADVVFKRSVDLAKVAPPGPVFRHRPRKVIVKNDERQETVESTAEEKVPSPEKKMKDKRSSKTNKMEFEDEYLGVVVPQGSLKVDELAKLLA